MATWAHDTVSPPSLDLDLMTSDLGTMPVAKFERDIVGVTLQDDPINLLRPNVN